MATPIAEYLIALGFKIDDIAQKRFGESLITTSANFLKLQKTAVDAAFEVGKAVEEIASNYENLYYLSQRTGATIGSLQATALGFSQVGLKAADAKGLVDQLALSLEFNPGTNSILKLLGVPITGDANAEMMGALHTLRNYPKVLQKGFGEQLGLNEFQLSMLLAPGALEKIQAAGAGLTAEQKAAGVDPQQIGRDSVALENSIRKLDAAFGVLADKVLSPLIPVLTRFTDDITTIVDYFSGQSLANGQTVYDRVLARGAKAQGGTGAFSDIGHWLASTFSISGSVPVNTGAYGDLSGISFGGGTSGGSGATAGWWTPERRQHAIQALIAGGVSPLGADALVSRWMNVESAGGPGSVNPTTGAFGIGQWLGGRKPGIAGDTNFDDQLAYTLRELHSSEGTALGALNSATTPWDAARGASMYERASGYNSALGTDDFTGRTAAGITIGAPQTTITIHGGSDPKATADYVLQGQTAWANDMLRNAGTGVR